MEREELKLESDIQVSRIEPKPNLGLEGRLGPPLVRSLELAWSPATSRRKTQVDSATSGTDLIHLAFC